MEKSSITKLIRGGCKESNGQLTLSLTSITLTKSISTPKRKELKGKLMKWREVKQEEYQEAFRRLREIIEMIESDPRIGYEGFEIKQKLREVARTLVAIEKELYGNLQRSI